jgi:[acyl-carrier-protein] S-malonyltransferase
MKLIPLFPGQGSQALGMGKSWHENFSVCHDLFQLASDTLKIDFKRLCFEGPEEELVKTENTQPCLLLVCFAGFKILEHEIGLKPAAAAGHSLGEYTALAAAGAISFEDALRTVRRRGELMSQAAGPGAGMMAVLGLSAEQAANLCEEAKGNDVLVPSNFNAPGQVVISGHIAAIDRGQAILKSRKQRGIRLKVSGAFHSPLMKDAALKLGEFLATINFNPPSFPVISNLEARPYPGKTTETLVRQMTSPVRWEESIKYLNQIQPDCFLEIGPGKVISGLVSKIAPQAKTLNFSESKDIVEIRHALG